MNSTNLILNNIYKKIYVAKDRRKAHKLLHNQILKLANNKEFIINSIINSLANKKFILNNADNLVLPLYSNGDIVVCINIFPPLKNSIEPITHDNIHHHGWRLLSTAVICGDGYETILFKKNCHKKISNEHVCLEIKKIFTHKKNKITFIDTETAHVVFHPKSLTATLAVWSADKLLLNQEFKKKLMAFPAFRKFIVKIIHSLGLTKILGLNQISGLYFSAENGVFKEMLKYKKEKDGSPAEIIPCFFKLFEKIGFSQADLQKIKKFIPYKYKNLYLKLLNKETLPEIFIKSSLNRQYSKREILNVIKKNVK